MPISQREDGQDSQGGPDMPTSRFGVVVDRIRRAPEHFQIALGVGVGVAALAIPLLLLLYSAAIWRAIVTAFLVAAVLAVLGGVGFLLVIIGRRSRERARKREQQLHEARSTGERRRAELLRSIMNGDLTPLFNHARH